MKPLTNQTVQALNNKEEHAFREVFYYYYPLMAARAYDIINDYTEANEVTIKSFQKLFSCSVAFKDASHIDNYLSKVVKNTCLNLLKAKKAYYRRYNELKSSHVEHPETEQVPYKYTDEQVNILAALIEKLTNSQRTIIALHLKGLRSKEISAALKISVSTVDVQRSRIIKLLRKGFNETND